MIWWAFVLLLVISAAILIWGLWPRNLAAKDDDPYEHEPTHDDRWGGF